jgi:hypothetical protein
MQLVSVSTIYGPHLPESYIKIVPHPHSSNTDITIIPLASNASLSSVATAFVPIPETRPWAPVTDFISFAPILSHGPPGPPAPVYIYLDLDTSFPSRASDYY